MYHLFCIRFKGYQFLLLLGGLLVGGGASIAQTVSTLAGLQGAIGNKNGTTEVATFNNPHGVEIDRNGNVYIADRYNHLIRKRDPNGNVTTFAGSGTAGSTDGQGTQASFKEPWGLTVDSIGNVYVADTKNNKIRKITPSGMVSTLAGSGSFGVTDATNPLAASFGNPTGIAIDTKGNIYISDHLTHLIRKVSPKGVVTTLAGNKSYPNNFGLVDGLGQGAKFYRPYGIEVDRPGNVYVADEWNHAIRKITALGEVTTLAGNGTKGDAEGIGAAATFNYPWDVAVDTAGNLYVADGYNFVIRRIDKQNQTSTFSGVKGVAGGHNGPLLEATFNGATSISLNRANMRFVVGDAYNQLVREITLAPASPILRFFNSAQAVQDSMAICQGETTSFDVQGIYDSYDAYVDGNKVVSMFDNTLSLPNLPVGFHNIVVKGIKGESEIASNQLTVRVRPNALFQVKSTKTDGLCMGDSACVFTSDSSSVTWNTGETSAFLFSKTSGKYYVVNTTNGQCLNKKDTISLAFHSLPEIKIQSPSAMSLYEGDTVALSASSGTSYLWSTQAKTSQIRVTQSGKYVVSVTNEFGCQAHSDTIVLQFAPKVPMLKVTASNTAFCMGDSVLLQANLAHSISWKKDGKPLGRMETAIYVRDPGNYSFDYMPSASKSYASDSVLVVSKSLPTVDFSTQLIEQGTQSERFQFNPNSLTASAYAWHWATSFSEEISPTISFTEEGITTVSLTLHDKNGCSATITKSVDISFGSQVFVPTGFTPNNDGQNDVVWVRGLAPTGQMKFLVFNEWGELIFSSSSIDSGWDGSYKGQPANAGNYSYLLQIDQNGHQEMYKGVITLLR